MKKILFTFCAAAIVFAGCKKEEPAGGDNTGGGNQGGGNTEYPTPVANTAYTLKGGVNADGFSWTEGSSLALYLSAAQNLECVMDPASVGQATGSFTTPKITLKKADLQDGLFLYSPYNPELVYYNGNIYGLKLSDKQVQTRPGVLSEGFRYGTAKWSFEAENTFDFTLTPVSAIAKVDVSTTSLAGYSVAGITLTDADGTAEFGGTFNLNVKTMELAKQETYKKVAVSVANKEPLQSGTAQSFYLQVLPGDYKDKTLYLTISLVKDGAQSLTLPVSKSGVEFKSGEVTTITVDNLSNDTDVDWYVTADSRQFTGLGYAYGEANTYLIQCKNGSTYKGATYSANASIPNEVSIDIRPRGDISKVVDPKGATFEWYTCGSANTIYTPRWTDYKETKIDPTQFTFEYDGNYTVKVKNTGAYAGSPILLMKKNGKVLWAWSFWNVAADGTQLSTVSVAGYQLANMEIGQATTQFDKWIKNTKDGATTPDLVFRTCHYYQFGRPIPTFWTSYWSLIWPQQPAGNVPAIEGPISLEQAMENPVGLILNPVKQAGLGNWCSEVVQDIWGGSMEGDNTFVGQKTIYDPCPKGWKVPHPAVLEALANSTATVKDQTGAVGVEFSAAPGVRFVANGYGNGKTGNTSDWRLATMGGGATGTKGNCTYGIIWSNMGGATSGTCLQFHTNGTANKLTPMDRANSGPVRCMKDPAAN